MNTDKLSQLVDNLNTFSFARYQITAKFTQSCSLPEYKGSTIHGGFGWALKATNPELYEDILAVSSGTNNNSSKPYILIPPLEKKQHYDINDTFKIEIKLFGDLCNSAQDILASIFTWQTMGLGPKRSQFQIQSIDCVLPQNSLRIYQHKIATNLLMPAHQTLGDKLKSHLIPEGLLDNQKAIAFIETDTRLRLTNAGVKLKQAPPLSLFCRSIAHRLAGLINYYGHFEDAGIHKLLPEIIESKPLLDNSTFSQISRYSKSQEHRHEYGGLLGSWAYSVDNQDVMVWLKLGELIHVGSKSSFGFGRYKTTIALAE